MTTWTPELKQEIVDAYLAAKPTPETNAEIMKDIAEGYEDMTPNGVRQVLVQAKVYVKKEAATPSTGTGKKTASGDAPKRVSKESQLDALRAAIKARGAEVDDEIVSKMTGKAAAYFVTVLG